MATGTAQSTATSPSTADQRRHACARTTVRPIGEQRYLAILPDSGFTWRDDDLRPYRPGVLTKGNAGHRRLSEEGVDDMSDSTADLVRIVAVLLFAAAA